MIDWITENVAIGEYSDGINAELLTQENIDCVLNLRAEDEKSDIEERLCKGIGVKYFRIAVGDYKGIDSIRHP